MEEKEVQSFVESTNSCTFMEDMDNSTDMKKLPEIDESKLGGNPFVNNLRIPVTLVVSSKDLVENEEGVVVNKTLVMEKTQKVELYYHECAGENIAGLSDKAQRLLLHILYTLKRKKDYYQFNKELYMRRNKIRSLTTVSNAIQELVRYEYIVKSCMNGVYWINPYKFFPGARLTVYPNNKVVADEPWDQTRGQKYEDKKKKKPPFPGFGAMMDEQAGELNTTG